MMKKSVKDLSNLQKEMKRTVAEVGLAGADQIAVRSTNLL